MAAFVRVCRLAAQVSQYYTDIEELSAIQQLRKYLGQVNLSVPFANATAAGTVALNSVACSHVAWTL